MENARIIFNMSSIGAKIAELRKAANMTQMDLADRLDISFQAVSNWERGLSMPDISKLPELAELFHVTVDELLGRRSEVVNHAINGTMDTLLIDQPQAIEELAGTVPLLHPSEVDQAVDIQPRLPIEEILGLLPYLSDKVCEEYALDAEKRHDPALSHLLPYVSEKTVDAIGGRAATIRELMPLCHFMSKEALRRKADEYVAAHDVKALTHLAPFLPTDYLRRIALEIGRAEGFGRIAPLAPYLGTEFFDRLLKRDDS